MHWEVNVITSVTLLAILQGQKVSGISQESVYVIECIRDIIPNQIYNDCCLRENNCTITRQQNRGIDCMSRIIMTNYSSLFSDSRENGPGTTDMNFSYQRGNQWYGDIADSLGETCRRQPRARLQNCIRNELIKKCRYSMLQDRFTSPSSRWTQRRYDTDTTFSDHFGHFEPRRRVMMSGGRTRPQQQESFFMMAGQPTESEYRYYSRGGYNEDSDNEEFGYSNGDSLRY